MKNIITRPDKIVEYCGQDFGLYGSSGNRYLDRAAIELFSDTNT